ncbi:MAG: 50S ribosomal protein L23 [Minisyncoccia bacterium]
MALFTKKDKKEDAKKEKTPKVKKASSEKVLANSKLEGVLSYPWMSEKALIGTERGVYVFAIPADATKTLVKQAVERLYKVVPKKVNIVNLIGKSKPLRGRRGYGRRAARHKAYVYLKKGDSISLA